MSDSTNVSQMKVCRPADRTNIIKKLRNCPRLLPDPSPLKIVVLYYLLHKLTNYSNLALPVEI